MRLLNVMKARIGYKKNKKVNFVAIGFSVGKIGERFYVYKIGEERYLLSRKEQSDYVYVKDIIVVGTNGAASINIWNMFEEPEYISIFEHKEGFVLRKSTIFEEQEFGRIRIRYKKSGHIGNTFGIHIIPDDLKKLTQKSPYTVCDVHLDDGVYMEVRAVKAEEFLKCKALNSYTQKEIKHNFTFQASLSGGSLNIPTKLIDKTKIKKQQFVKTGFNNEGNMIIEIEPIICDICGHEIQRKTEDVFEKIVSYSSKKAVSMVQKVITSTSGTTKEKREQTKYILDCDLTKAKSILEKLLKVTEELNKELCGGLD